MASVSVMTCLTLVHERLPALFPKSSSTGASAMRLPWSRAMERTSRSKAKRLASMREKA